MNYERRLSCLDTCLSKYSSPTRCNIVRLAANRFILPPPLPPLSLSLTLCHYSISFSVSLSLSLSLSVTLCLCLSLSLSPYHLSLSVPSLSVSFSLSLSVSISVRLSPSTTTTIPLSLSATSVSFSVCQYLSLSVCLSVCLPPSTTTPLSRLSLSRVSPPPPPPPPHPTPVFWGSVNEALWDRFETKNPCFGFRGHNRSGSVCTLSILARPAHKKSLASPIFCPHRSDNCYDKTFSLHWRYLLSAGNGVLRTR